MTESFDFGCCLASLSYLQLCFPSFLSPNLRRQWGFIFLGKKSFTYSISSCNSSHNICEDLRIHFSLEKKAFELFLDEMHDKHFCEQLWNYQVFITPALYFLMNGAFLVNEECNIKQFCTNFWEILLGRWKNAI